VGDEASYIQLPLLKQAPGVRHFFGTRRLKRDQVERDCQAIFLKQVHGDRVVSAEALTGETEADGLKTKRPGQWIAVSTADCLPVLFFDPVQRVAVALHAGWRGSVRNIAGKGVRNLVFNEGSRPEDLLVGMGPAISPCCFEVGPEAADAVRQQTPYGEQVLRAKGGGKWWLDLPLLNRHQMRDAGVPDAQIQAVARCTCCDPKHFLSYRRDHKKGENMISGIMLL